MKWIVPIVLLCLFSCKKSEDRNCFKSTGELTSKEIPLVDFDKIYFGPHLKYILVQDTINKVVLHGGKNLLNFVETSVDDDARLNVRNNNKCNFLRDYDKVITVEIHLKFLRNMLFEGTHELTCQNTLNTDYLAVVMTDGAGFMSLDVNAYQIFCSTTNGWCNFELKGNVQYLNLQIEGNGFGSTYGLHVSDSLDVISNTPEIVKVNADGCIFRAQTLKTGDIWYIGYPQSVTWNAYGEGELLDKN
jgi:hypothetical protein